MDSIVGLPARTRDGAFSVAADCEAYALRSLDAVPAPLSDIRGWAAENGVPEMGSAEMVEACNTMRGEAGLPPFVVLGSRPKTGGVSNVPAAPEQASRPVLAGTESELLDLVLHHDGTITATVTPEVGGWLLKLNEGNRPVNRAQVERFKGLLAAGKFRVTGEPVIVAREGLLNDGQHRLMAIVDSGIGAVLDVRFGVDREAFLHTGTAKTRTAAHTAHILGATFSTTQAAVARLLFLHDADRLGVRGGAVVENSDVIEVMVNNPAIAALAKFIQLQKFTPVRAASFGFALMLASRVASMEKVQEFGSLVGGGRAPDDDPTRLLHVRLRDARMKDERLTQTEVAALTVRAWNAWGAGKPMRQLKLMPIDTTPGKFPAALPIGDGT